MVKVVVSQFMEENYKMKKPYIICHMMTSVDGRIDCAMTEQLPGVEDYYQTLDELDVPTTVSGRVTAELEIAEGIFETKKFDEYGKTGYSKKCDANGYEVILDTKGKLLWPHATNMEKPYLIVTSEKVSKEYLDYLDQQNISWIVCGKEKIDLNKVCEILYEEFHVERMGIVGAPAINTSFLDEGLLDEISLLIGAGIDGRKEFPSVFDGLENTHPLIHLKLLDVKRFKSDAIWLRYKA